MCGEGGCFRSFAKVILIIVNIIFCLAGLLMLALGIALTVAPEKVIDFAETTTEIKFDDYATASGGLFEEIIRASGIFMIILGSVVFIIAFFGFVGACCESKCILVTYAIILIIIVLAEVALIIFAAVYPDKFADTASDALTVALKKEFTRDFNYNGNFTDDVGKGSKAWSVVQVGWKCCGANNNSDYERFNWVRSNCSGTCYQKVPLSCCKLKKNVTGFPTSRYDFINAEECVKNPTNDTTNLNGCTDAIINSAKDLILDYSKIAIGIAAGIVGVELILIALAFFLCCIGDRSSKYV
jgi:hypothetical protein